MEVYLVKYHDKYEKCYVLSVILSIETHGDILSPLKSVDTLLTAFSAAVLFLKERWNAASIESLCWYSVVMWYLLLLWCLPCAVALMQPPACWITGVCCTLQAPWGACPFLALVFSRTWCQCSLSRPDTCEIRFVLVPERKPNLSECLPYCAMWRI